MEVDRTRRFRCFPPPPLNAWLTPAMSGASYMRINTKRVSPCWARSRGSHWRAASPDDARRGSLRPSPPSKRQSGKFASLAGLVGRSANLGEWTNTVRGCRAPSPQAAARLHGDRARRWPTRIIARADARATRASIASNSLRQNGRGFAPNFSAAAYISRNQTAADNRDQSFQKSDHGSFTEYHGECAKKTTDDAPGI